MWRRTYAGRVPDDHTLRAVPSPSTLTPRPVLAFALASVGLVNAAVVVALLRWSAWWPHSDNRQNWANLVLGAAALAACVCLPWAALVSAPHRRTMLLVLTLTAAGLGWLLGFEYLADSTPPGAR